MHLCSRCPIGPGPNEPIRIQGLVRIGPLWPKPRWMIPTPTASLNPHANVAQEPNPFGPTIGYGPRNKGDLNPNQKHIYITYRVPYKYIHIYIWGSPDHRHRVWSIFQKLNSETISRNGDGRFHIHTNKSHIHSHICIRNLPYHRPTAWEAVHTILQNPKPFPKPFYKVEHKFKINLK